MIARFLYFVIISLFLQLSTVELKANPDSLRQEAIKLLLKAEYDSAITIYDKIIPQFYEKKDYYQYIKSYSGVLFAYFYQQKFDDIIELSTSKVPIAVELLGEQDSMVAELCYYAALAYQAKEDFSTANNYFKKSLTIKKLYDDLDLVDDYRGLSRVAVKRGDFESVIDYNKKIIEIETKRGSKNRLSLTYSYSEIARAYGFLKLFDEAIPIHKRLLMQYSKKPKSKRYSSLLNNYGMLYESMGEYEKALDYLKERLEYNLRYQLPLDNVYGNLSFIYSKQKKYKDALQLRHRAHRLKLKKKKTLFIAKSHSEYGEVYIGLQNYDSALWHLQRSFINFLPSFNDSSIYVNPSLEATNSEDALLYAVKRKAVAFTAKSIQTKSAEDRKMALETFWASMKLIDKMRQQFEAQGSKTALADRTWWAFEAAIKGCLDLYEVTGDVHYQAEAFKFAEKSKAVLVQDAVAESAAQQHANLPDTLLNYEHDLKVEITYLENELFQAEKRKKEEKANEVRSKLLTKREELRQFAVRLEKEFPNYHELKYRKPNLALTSIQSQLASDQALIEYFVGDEAIYLFCITKEGLSIQNIAQAAELEDLVSQLRESLNPKEKRPDEKLVYQQFVKSAYALQQLVLSGVLAELPQEIQQLTIIPDGLLGYVPFEVLLTAPADPEIPDYRAPAYLIKRYEINYAYAASLLHNPLKGLNNPSENGVLAFAPSYPKAITDSAEVQQLGRFRDQVTELIWNTKEVEKISEYLPTAYFTANDATESKFRELASQYRIIHLAMHALVDDDNPMQSRLVFTKNENQAEDDSYLNAFELYNMKLNADLAILSACNTGYGKYVRGEGLVSLGRAFAYAGCPSVVISHWSVDDEATSQLMQGFYQSLSQGLNKSESMRQAKLAYLAQAGPRQANPVFWGSFVLIGDAEPITGGASWWLWVLGTVTLIAIVAGVRRKFAN